MSQSRFDRMIVLEAARARALKPSAGAEERARSGRSARVAFARAVGLMLLWLVTLAPMLGCTVGGSVVGGDAATADPPGELVTVGGETFRVIASASAVIGPEGGTVGLDNFMIDVPAGALAAPVTLTVQETDKATPYGALRMSPMFRVLPEGTTFAVPIRASIVFSGDPSRVRVAWSQPTGDDYDVLRGVVDGNVITASNTHLSFLSGLGDVAITAGLQLFDEFVLPGTSTIVDAACCNLSTAGCANTQTDPQNCGGCSSRSTADLFRCGIAGATCVRGRCDSCPSGSTMCGSVCCGTCNSAGNGCATCPPGYGICPSSPGRCCQFTCPGGGTICGERCCSTCDPTHPTHCASCPTGSFLHGGNCLTCPTGNMSCGNGYCCPNGTTCRGDQCITLSCPPRSPPTSPCGQFCRSLSTDRNNCGRCGNVCPGNQNCLSGVCACPPGRTLCGLNCVDLSRDLNSCGRCGNRCGPDSRCVSGICTPICAAPLVRCNGACVDPRTSNSHCNGCGRACGAGRTCLAGRCEITCPAPNVRCGDRCADTLNGRNDCGGCGMVCGADSYCAGGRCTLNCQPPQLWCNGACVDPRTNDNNCGRCSNSCLGIPGFSDRVCTAGSCTCPTGRTQCGGLCADLQVSNTNCGACGTSCRPFEACTRGVCVGPSANPEAPSSGSIVTSQRPTFRWRLYNWATEAVVDICRDRACTMIVASSPPVTGVSWQPPAALAPGHYYWRTNAFREGIRWSQSSARRFDVGRLSAPIDTSYLIGGGDFDGDGFNDVIANQNAANSVGYYRGVISGLEPSSFRPSAPAGAQDFGFRIAFAGDIDNDGLSDSVVGRPSTNTVLVYLSRSIATVGYGGSPLAPPPGARNFGWSVASAGDPDRNGYADIIVGAPGSNQARVFYYDVSGVAITVDLAAPSGTRGFGNGVASAGDVNGDGYSDFLVTAPDSNRVFVYLGNSDRNTVRTPSVALSAPPSTSALSFGASAATAGDINADGYSDILIGTFGGGFSLYLGGPTGTSVTPSFVSADRDAVTSIVTAAGDVNADGYGDVVVGQPEEARVRVYYGGPTGLSNDAGRVTTLTGPAGSGFGQSVRGGGDVNNDGIDDVLVGQPLSTPALVSVYYGSAMGVRPGSVDTIMGARGFGYSVASVGEQRGGRVPHRTTRDRIFGPRTMPLFASNMLMGVTR